MNLFSQYSPQYFQRLLFVQPLQLAESHSDVLGRGIGRYKWQGFSYIATGSTHDYNKKEQALTEVAIAQLAVRAAPPNCARKMAIQRDCKIDELR